MHELYYTSVPRGLAAGTSGYTVVAQTTGIGMRLAEVAVSLSSHAPLDATNPRAFASEPVNWVHLITDQAVHVVSRIGSCAPDHTERSNFLAHHLLLSPADLQKCPAGPAELLATPNLFMTAWAGEPREFAPRTMPALGGDGPTTAGITAAGLDPGWAESLADRLRDRTVRETWLVYPRGMDMLSLMRSVLSHLTPEERWAATFTTLATRKFPGMAMHARVKCVVSESPYANEVLTKEGAYDLGKRPRPPERRKLVAASKPTTVVGLQKPKIRESATSGSGGSGNYRGDVADHNLDDLTKWASSLPSPAQSPAEPAAGLAWWANPWIVMPWLLAMVTTGLCAVSASQWINTRSALTSVREELQASGKISEREAAKAKKYIADKEAEIAGLQEQIQSLKRVPEEAAPAKEPSPQAAMNTEPARPEPSRGEADNGQAQTIRPQSKPQVIQSAIAEASGQSLGRPVVLIKGLGQLSLKEDVTIGGAGVELIGYLRDDSRPDDLQLKILKKLTCRFEFVKNEGDLKIKVLKDSWLKYLRYFEISVRPKSSEPMVIPLGTPLAYKLKIRPIAKAKDHEDIKHVLDVRYELFPSEQGKEIEEAIPPLQGVYSSLEFADSAGVAATIFLGPNNEPCVSFVDEQADAGLVLKSTSSDKKIHEIVAIITSAKDQKWWWRDNLEQECERQLRASRVPIPKDADEKTKNKAEASIMKAKERVQGLMQDLTTAVRALGKFSDLPLRWTLCKPVDPSDLSKGLDTQNGLVVIDSLSPPGTQK